MSQQEQANLEQKIRNAQILGNALAASISIFKPFVQHAMDDKYGENNWLSKGTNPHMFSDVPKSVDDFDIKSFIGLIIEQRSVFDDVPPFNNNRVRSYLYTISNYRNMWAHQKELSDWDILRALDAVFVLLSSINQCSSIIQGKYDPIINYIENERDNILLTIATNVYSKRNRSNNDLSQYNTRKVSDNFCVPKDFEDQMEE